MSEIVIRKRDTHEEEHRLDVTGKTDREIDRIMNAMVYKVDFERFYFGLEDLEN